MATTPLITTDILRDEMGISGTTYDALLLRKIVAASKEIVAWCQQPILAEAGNVTIGFTRSDAMRIPFFPIESLDLLTTMSAVGAELVTVDPSSYRIDVYRGVSYLAGTFARGITSVLTLTVGHTEVPEDVADVCLEMARIKVRGTNITQAQGRDTLGLKQIAEGGPGVPTKTRIYENPDWQEKLAPYRMVRL